MLLFDLPNNPLLLPRSTDIRDASAPIVNILYSSSVLVVFCCVVLSCLLCIVLNGIGLIQLLTFVDAFCEEDLAW